MAFGCTAEIQDQDVRIRFGSFVKSVRRCIASEDWASLARCLESVGVYEDGVDFDKVYGRRNWKETPRLAFAAEHRHELNELARQILVREGAFRELRNFLIANGNRRTGFSDDRWKTWWPWAQTHFFHTDKL